MLLRILLLIKEWRCILIILRLKSADININMKKNNKKKKGFPDLTGDGKVTFKDVLKGRGIIGNGKKGKSLMSK